MILMCLLVGVLIPLAGCAGSPHQPLEKVLDTPQEPKLFVIILDALKRRTLMESIDSLPNFKAAIMGNGAAYPYIAFENVLVSIPSSSKPSNTTLLTGVYPCRHGVPSTMWFDRKEEKIITLKSITQRRIINILKKNHTDTLFDYARKSGKSSLAVATQVTKGVPGRDWIKQSVHLWGQAFWINLLQDGNSIPDGAHLDRGTTKGLLRGHAYSSTDGLEGKLKTGGNIPDLVVVHYVGMDIFTHYPRRFMVKENWTIDEIQKWYLREVLDPELGKIMAFLQENKLLENTIFFFVADHGQTKIIEHVDEKGFEKRLAKKFKVKGRPHSIPEADIIIMPGAGTKVIYVKDRTDTDWMSPPRLLEDVKPVTDALIDDKDMREHLNALLVARYPGERDQDLKGLVNSDVFWFFNLKGYRQSNREDDDFVNALEPLSELDELVGKELRAAYMYCRDFSRENIPDIILINQPGHYFTPDRGKYAHHGGIYADDVYVSFVVSGPQSHRFSNRPQTIARQIETSDLVPMAAHLAGIKIDKPIDGRNWLLDVK
jgi:arylsulfatase A-like enzyme